MQKKLQKIYLTYYNLLLEQDLWQVHYQILTIIFLKEFIKLNVNLNMMIKNVGHVQLNIILLLQKGVYPHEYMDDWEKFNETS